MPTTNRKPGRASRSSVEAEIRRRSGSMIGSMTAQRLTISLDPNLAAAVQSAAASAGESVSAWIAHGATRRLRQDGLLDVIADWEQEHGAITARELEAARKRIGVSKGTAGRDPKRSSARRPAERSA